MRGAIGPCCFGSWTFAVDDPGMHGDKVEDMGRIKVRRRWLHLIPQYHDGDCMMDITLRSRRVTGSDLPRAEPWWSPA